MSLRDVVLAVSSRFRGRRISSAAMELCMERLEYRGEWAEVFRLMEEFPLAGTEISLEEGKEDASGLGVEMLWLTPTQMISEVLEAHPGKQMWQHGYLPIGACLRGSGDPYCLRPDEEHSWPVIRVPHEAVAAGEAEDVCASLEALFREASWE